MLRLVEQEDVRHHRLGWPTVEPADARGDGGARCDAYTLTIALPRGPPRAQRHAPARLVLEHLDRDGLAQHRCELRTPALGVDHSRRAASAALTMASVCAGQSGSKLRNGTRERRSTEAARYHSSEGGRRP